VQVPGVGICSTVLVTAPEDLFELWPVFLTVRPEPGVFKKKYLNLCFYRDIMAIFFFLSQCVIESLVK